MVVLHYQRTNYEANGAQVSELRGTDAIGRRLKIGAWEPYVRRFMRWGIFFALGWAAATSYYKVEHLWSQKAALVKEATCEHRRAEVALDLIDEGNPPPPAVSKDCVHVKQ